MLVALSRVLILYVVTISAVRLMGKRQVGELQPTELVATILISDIAAIPMQDNDLPIVNSVAAVLILVCFEIFNSVISLKSYKFRELLQGKPVTVIRSGVIDQKNMKQLRLTVSDLTAALRQKNIFDIEEVAYAVMETNGQLSVLTKSEKSPVTPEQMKIKTPPQTFPFVVISDGAADEDSMKEAGITMEELKKMTENKDIKKILIMTVDGNKKKITKKEK